MLSYVVCEQATYLLWLGFCFLFSFARFLSSLDAVHFVLPKAPITVNPRYKNPVDKNT